MEVLRTVENGSGYSLRSIVAGSTRVARRIGKYAAILAAAIRTKVAASSAGGSNGRTSYSRVRVIESY
jgi:hypothetical protein